MILIIFIIMRKKLDSTEKKQKITVTVNPELVKVVTELYSNKSKYIEKLIFHDLKKNKLINNNINL